MNIRVVLVDDHAVVREGIKVLLESEKDIQVVGEADSGEKALEVAASANPQAVIMDLRLKNMDGLEATRLLKESNPGLKVIVLSMHDEDELVVRALKAGADGYVLKRAGVGELVRAIRQVIKDGAYLDPALIRQVVYSLQKEVPSGLTRQPEKACDLTPREKEILGLVARGLTNAEIARQLFISVKTVQAHRANLMQKLGIHDRVDLVKHAIKIGLLSLEGDR